MADGGRDIDNGRRKATIDNGFIRRLSVIHYPLSILMADLDPIVRPFLLAWFAFFGACIGSFLNVVVYRLPRGKSLINPPSFCPKCGHPIRWHDNVPVFGWIMLGGKCRDCKAPISVRYPAVEAICGAVFGTTAYVLLQITADISLTGFFFETIAFAGVIVFFFAAALIHHDKKYDKK